MVFGFEFEFEILGACMGESCVVLISRCSELKEGWRNLFLICFRSVLFDTWFLSYLGPLSSRLIDHCGKECIFTCGSLTLFASIFDRETKRTVTGVWGNWKGNWEGWNMIKDCIYIYIYIYPCCFQSIMSSTRFTFRLIIYVNCTYCYICYLRFPVGNNTQVII